MFSDILIDELRAVVRSPVRLLLLIVLALVVSSVEIISEYNTGQRTIDMADDLVLFFLSLLVATVLLLERIQNRRALAELQLQLSDARGRLQSVDQRSRNIGRQYREVMQKQFDAWGLTDSEQEIVISLLKGLSFREIASMRETREKTVRQQATGIYRKAGLSGRHELAAWFFEDLLDPPDDADA